MAARVPPGILLTRELAARCQQDSDAHRRLVRAHCALHRKRLRSPFSYRVPGHAKLMRTRCGCTWKRDWCLTLGTTLGEAVEEADAKSSCLAAEVGELPVCRGRVGLRLGCLPYASRRSPARRTARLVGWALALPHRCGQNRIGPHPGGQQPGSTKLRGTGVGRNGGHAQPRRR